MNKSTRVWSVARLVRVAALTFVVVSGVLSVVVPDRSGRGGLAVNLVGAVVVFSAVGFTTTAADHGGFRRTWRLLIGRPMEDSV